MCRANGGVVVLQGTFVKICHVKVVSLSDTSINCLNLKMEDPKVKEVRSDEHSFPDYSKRWK